MATRVFKHGANYLFARGNVGFDENGAD